MDINHLLDLQIELSNRLLDLLEVESVAIAKRIAKDIEDTAFNKAELIDKIKEADQNIGSHKHVSDLKIAPYLKEKVDRINLLILHCKSLNEANGEALKRAQISFNQLNNLIQSNYSNLGVTYNAKGQTTSLSSLGTNLKV